MAGDARKNLATFVPLCCMARQRQEGYDGDWTASRKEKDPHEANKLAKRLYHALRKKAGQVNV